jgi:hypothetical protein
MQLDGDKLTELLEGERGAASVSVEEVEPVGDIAPIAYAATPARRAAGAQVARVQTRPGERHPASARSWSTRR